MLGNILFFKNCHKLLGIHLSFNLCHPPNLIPLHTTPYHYIFTPMLDCFLDLLVKQGLTLLYPHPPMPFDPNLLIFVSFDKITPFKSSTVHSLYFKAKFKHYFQWRAKSGGFFFFTTSFILCFLRTFFIVWIDRRLLIMLQRFLATSAAFSTFTMLIWLMIAFSSIALSFFGLSPLRFFLLGMTFFASLETVVLLHSSLEAISP